MKENMEQMRNRHNEEINDLRSNCKHKKMSEWTSSQWAPGHIGPPVRVCTHCEKISDQRTTIAHPTPMCDHMGWPKPNDPCPCGFWKGKKISKKDLLTPISEWEKKHSITETRDDMK